MVAEALKVRFNDMIGTVMAQPQSDAVSRQIVWRQLVDILAQSHSARDAGSRKAAFGWLASVRAEIAPTVRQSVARSIAPRVRAPDLVAYFAADDAAIAAPLIRHAHLEATEWRDILPAMPTSSRALLRERRDLPAGVELALTSFGSADFALQAPPLTVPGSPEIGQTPIADIVARIEAFRAQRASEAPDRATLAQPAVAAQFLFETDAEGEINFVTGDHRASLRGISIASVGEGWLCGVDGHAAGAFRAHTSFSSARLRVAGVGPASGDWLIDGEPIFEPSSGKFLGYRGSARRPMPHERAERSSPVTPSGDSLRQLVHELRTPLNAIQGFAEMIEREMLGPIAPEYRARARNIMHEGGRLLAAIEDVDMAARIDHQAFESDAAHFCDAAALLSVVGRELNPLSDQRHVHLRISRAATEMPVRVASAALHRLFTRLLGAMLGIAEMGETLEASLTAASGSVHFSVSRPRVLLGQESHELLAPESAPDRDWPDSPLLGLSFGLRLIDSLAQAADVKFRIEDQRFSLILPATHDSATQHARTPIAHGDDRYTTRPPQAD